MPDSPALDVRGLVKRYGDRTAVDGLDLRADHGAVTAVLGPNGAGKTTLIECCEGLRRPDSGRVEVLGHRPGDPAVRPRVGVMLQDAGLPTGAPARYVLDHAAAMYARPRDPGELAAVLGVDGFARTSVRRLSGGQRQRLALACALVGDPELVFLDEPGAGLDPQARQVVWDLVRAQRARGAAVVLTTHQLDEAQALADRVVVVDHGRAVADGTVGELLAAGRDDRAGSTLRLRTDRPVPIGALRDLVAPAVEVREVADGALSLRGPVDPALVAAVTALLARHDVLVLELGVGARTLEDVFLDLTGRDLR